MFITVSHAFISTTSRYAARRNSGPSWHSAAFAKIVYIHFDGLALRRSRIWIYLIRAFKQVLRMFVVGMR